MICPQLDLYTPVLGQSSLIDDLFNKLRQKVAVETRLQDELVQVKGALEMVLAGSALS
jgi:U3 small nucleolar RNA-associated protein 15